MAQTKGLEKAANSCQLVSTNQKAHNSMNPSMPENETTGGTPPQSQSQESGLAAFDPHLKMERILVPVDFTPASLHALRYAAQMAKKFGGTITLLHVVDCGVLSDGMDKSMLVKSSEEVAREAAVQLKELAAGEIGQISHSTEVRVGKPSEEIIRAAEALGSDMVILAVHEYKGLQRIIHRHTSKHIEKEAHCPVLTLHCDEAGDIEPKLWKGQAKSRIGEVVGQIFLKAFGTPND
jgi:nucleotide-binding universal stress UspA family protein